MAYVPPTQIFPFGRNHYFDCEYCKGPLGADSKGHCAGCGAPRQAIPPLFNVASLPQQRIFQEAYPEMGQWLWEQQYLGNRQLTSFENALRSRGLW